MTKYNLEFVYGYGSIMTKKDMETLQLKNFFVKRDNDLAKLGYLPPVVRSISPPIKTASNEYRYIVIVERKPVVESLRVTQYREEELVYDLPLPWQHYFVVLAKSTYTDLRFREMGMYFSQSSLSTLEHKFYTPYLPNVYVENILDNHTLLLPYKGAADSISLENLCFSTDSFKFEQYGFTNLFDQLYSTYWHGGTWNADLYAGAVHFAEKYDPKSAGNESEGCYTRMAKALRKIAQIPLQDILSDEVFKAAAFSFTFADYLKAVSENAEKNLFDFKSLFEQSLDAGKVIDIVEKKYKPFRIKKTVAKAWQDTNGRWRRTDGTFASYEEIMEVRGY